MTTTISQAIKSKQTELVSRPEGNPGKTNFTANTVKLSPIVDGEILVRNQWMSVDGYGRLGGIGTHLESVARHHVVCVGGVRRDWFDGRSNPQSERLQGRGQWAENLRRFSGYATRRASTLSPTTRQPTTFPMNSASSRRKAVPITLHGMHWTTKVASSTWRQVVSSTSPEPEQK